METIVYFQCNNWEPTPKRAERLIYEYLDKDDAEDSETIDWVKANNLCICIDIYDMSIQYWITTTKEWLEENFPELLSYASEEPKDFLFKYDKKYFLKYTKENIGVTYISDKFYEDNKEKFIDSK